MRNPRINYGELRLAVRMEKFELVREKQQIIKRLNAIEQRLSELETAENLLEEP